MFKNPASEFVYLRTYSKWIDNKNRREIWPETVKRFVDFIKEERGELIPAKVLKKIEEKILNFEVMPSMRAMWAAGNAAKFDNTCMYNCSFLNIDSIEAFSEAFYILMCGTGLGFSVDQKMINKNFNEVPKINPDDKEMIIIDDSRSGWADSVYNLVNNLFQGKECDFDYSQIRPKGARLKTMGGRASGPAPLITLHSFIRETFYAAQDRKLKTIEVNDILNQIADSVVVGGVRRSSQISLSSLDDLEMRNAKIWPFPPRRSMSNNSAIYTTKPNAVDFLKEWSSLASSGTGERGIFNIEAVKYNTPKRRDSSLIVGTNPCVTGNTEILTKDGYVRIDEVVDTQQVIWNGFEWSEVTPKITGYNQSLKLVTLSNGMSLTCTDYHRFKIVTDYNETQISVNAKDLEIGMKLIKHNYPIIEHGPVLKNAYTNGFVAAEGMELNRTLYVYKPKEICLNRLEDIKINKWEENNKRYKIILNETPMSKNFVPIQYELKSKLDWLSGLFDGDGTELIEGGLQISSVNRSFLFNVQKLLTTVGIASKISMSGKAGLKSMPNHKGGMSEYYCQDCYRLMIGAVQMQELKKLGLSCERMEFDKVPQRDASQFVKVINIEDAGIADKVYCFNEPKRHLGVFNGILTEQCGEITLRSKQFCNLSEVIIREDDDIDSLLEKIETAVWIGAIQSTFTYFPYLRKTWKNNCEEERLLGVSLTGQMDNPNLLSEDVLKLLRQKSIKITKHAAQKLDINISTAITCVKPSGTVSQLVDSSSGIHTRFAPYYIRRYRISSTDPLFKMIKDQGIKLNKENGQEQLKDEEVSTWVIEFPVKSPDKSITRDKMTALDQLEWYKKVQTNYCEHNASMTIYVKDSEWFEVGNWVYKNWSVISGISFLPYDGGHYKQAPYEEITKEQYDKMITNFKPIDYAQLSKYELEDNTEGAKMYNCSGDKCEIT